VPYESQTRDRLLCMSTAMFAGRRCCLSARSGERVSRTVVRIAASCSATFNFAAFALSSEYARGY